MESGPDAHRLGCAGVFMIARAISQQMKAAAVEESQDASPDERKKLPTEAPEMRTFALGRWRQIAAVSDQINAVVRASRRSDY
jgi:hypothetical protein